MKELIIFLYFVLVSSEFNFFQEAVKFYCPFFNEEDVKIIHQNIYISCQKDGNILLGLDATITDRIKEKNHSSCNHFFAQIETYFIAMNAFEPPTSGNLRKVFTRIFLSKRPYRVELNILNFLQELILLLENDTHSNNSSYYCGPQYSVLFSLIDGILWHAAMFDRLPLKAHNRISEITSLIELRCRTDFGKEIDNLIFPILKLNQSKASGPPIPVDTENSIILTTWERYSRLLVLKKSNSLLYNRQISPQANLILLVDLLRKLKEGTTKINLFNLLEPCYLCDFLNSLSYLLFQDDKVMRENIFELKSLIISVLEQIGMLKKKII